MRNGLRVFSAWREKMSKRDGRAWRQRKKAAIEPLEVRRLLSVSVLTGHYDSQNTGENLQETTLTPANVTAATFGKLYATPVDGQVDAQPLYDPAVDITAGSAQGVHNVLYVATENDSLYAIDADTGAVLWQD